MCSEGRCLPREPCPFSQQTVGSEKQTMTPTSNGEQRRLNAGSPSRTELWTACGCQQDELSRERNEGARRASRTPRHEKSRCGAAACSGTPCLRAGTAGREERARELRQSLGCHWHVLSPPLQFSRFPLVPSRTAAATNRTVRKLPTKSLREGEKAPSIAGSPRCCTFSC